MTDYAKRTVVELQEILKSRSLPYTGKKADLVARLNEADQTAEAQAAAEPAIAEPASAVTQSPSIQQATQPVVSAAATSAPEPDPESIAPQAENAAMTTGDGANALAYSLHLAQSDVSAELAKRKARAERFGTGLATSENNNTGDDEAAKSLERAKRFGTGQTAIGKLDEALPEEIERGARRKARANGEAGAMDDPGLKNNFRGTFRNRGSNRRSNSRPGQKPTGVQKQSAAYSSDKDRQAAEVRKKRFTQAS